MLPILPILGFAIKYAPGLLGLFAGEKAGDAAAGVINAVKDVLGTTDPVEAQARVEASPALEQELTARLNAEVERFKAEVEMRKAELADVANARQMNVALNEQGSPQQWLVFAITLAMLVGFFAAFGALFFIRQEIPDKLFSLMNVLYGGLVSILTMIVQFWFGSSSSSQKKDASISNALERAAAPAGRAVESVINKASR